MCGAETTTDSCCSDWHQSRCRRGDWRRCGGRDHLGAVDGQRRERLFGGERSQWGDGRHVHLRRRESGPSAVWATASVAEATNRGQSCLGGNTGLLIDGPFRTIDGQVRWAVGCATLAEYAMRRWPASEVSAIPSANRGIRWQRRDTLAEEVVFESCWPTTVARLRKSE